MDLPEIIERVDTIPGWFTPEEMAVVFPYAQKATSVLEIGTYHGRSTMFWALCAPEARITAVDPQIGGYGWPPVEVDPKVLGMQNVVIVAEFSHVLAHDFNFPIDLLFIDGRHEYEDAARDIELWVPKTQGIVVCHDYPGWVGVRQAVDECLRWRVEVLADEIIFVGATKEAA